MTCTEMLSRLKRRLKINDSAQDELLTDLLADANALMLAYMNRTELPAVLHSAQCHLACILYNRLGMEGETSRSEGAVTMTVDTLPAEIVSQLTPYRLCRVVTM